MAQGLLGCPCLYCFLFSAPFGPGTRTRTRPRIWLARICMFSTMESRNRPITHHTLCMMRSPMAVTAALREGPDMLRVPSSFLFGQIKKQQQPIQARKNAPQFHFALFMSSHSLMSFLSVASLLLSPQHAQHLQHWQHWQPASPRAHAIKADKRYSPPKPAPNTIAIQRVTQ